MHENQIIVLISANSEWRAVKEILSPSEVQSTPFGETFIFHNMVFFQGGWGKISAAASTQYVIDHYHPRLLINLGTCGGFKGRIEAGSIILATRTIVYDILEQMSDPEDAIAHFSTEIDLSWLTNSPPGSFQHGLLISADRDIVPHDIPNLIRKYGAVAADWESGAISWVAQKNRIRCLVLRGVTDLVDSEGGEAYGNIDLFHENTMSIMKTLINQLPSFIARIE